MTDHDAVEAAVRITGVARYRYLCSPANTLPSPNAPADYLRYCREIAARGGPPLIAVDYGTGPTAPPCGTCP